MSKTRLKKHFIYWILPSAITVVFSVVYFFNLFGAAQVIAPDFNREFGLLENLQLFLLILIFYLCIKKFKNSLLKWEKYCFLLLAFFTIFIFLEELDYGMHFIDYLNGKSTEAVKHEMYVEKKARNIHNANQLNGKFKTASYILIIALFVVLPLLPARVKNRFTVVNFLSPSKWIVTTAVSLLATNKFAFYLYKNHNEFNRSMDGNVTEFEEKMIYYIILLYVWEITKKQTTFSYTNLPASKTSQ